MFVKIVPIIIIGYSLSLSLMEQSVIALQSSYYYY